MKIKRDLLLTEVKMGVRFLMPIFELITLC
jgi:hypothetical protein